MLTVVITTLEELTGPRGNQLDNTWCLVDSGKGSNNLQQKISNLPYVTFITLIN